MNRPTLKSILQSAYDRNQWISTLQFLTGKRDLLTVHLSPIILDFTTREANYLIKSFDQIGIVKTSDGVSIPIFEIILQDDVKIEYNRVGVNEFIKKHIIKDAVKGALVTFSYDEDHEKSEWHFSFISKNSASDFFAEAEAQETNPKKFTYIFGNSEEHRTAIERLYNLEQSRFRLEDFFEAFNVEPVSKKFFEEYKHLYREFSDFIIGKEDYKVLFENPEIVDLETSEKQTQKEIRNFVGRLLGRIVFLYFLQKKNWLGSTTTDYTDGSTTFLSDLFAHDSDNREDFYAKYLAPIFFNALNEERKKDNFTLENGDTICIPFLNGGLFEEDQEKCYGEKKPLKHRTIKFPAGHFKMLFDFFNSYNFTVYENSPEEHTVAVDPEMLGHIFENLIDYNKDTGTFYTPKEIVQYMTQESLTEYLNTHLEKNRSEIENLIKNQTFKNFTDQELQQIDNLLDSVKICDPAIGSGAFPMGMLQEIFNLKSLIAFKLNQEWKPAEVKENIIQNSIYGVDLDEGAVEIARLRFWLSLVVDEGMPKALPNLDYKIMQGNSLLESFRGIDLSNLENVQEQGITEQTVLDYGQDFATQITLFDNLSFEALKELVKEYFNAGTSGSRSKSVIKEQIDDYIEAKIHAKIFWEKDRYNDLIDKFYTKYNIQKDNDLTGFNLKSKELKELLERKKKLEELTSIENELISLQTKKERPYFLWHLYFADVLDNGGFDIVIGNPPYIEFKKIEPDIKIEYSKYYETAKRKYDVFGLFIELSKNILKEKGVHCYINPTTFLMKDFGITIRDIISNEFKVIEIIDFSDFQIFETAITYTGIFLLKKEKILDYNFYYQKLSGNTKVKEKKSLFQNKKSSDSKEVSVIYRDKLSETTWIFGNTFNAAILKNIERNPPLKSFSKYTFQGIASGKDEVFYLKKGEIQKLDLETELFQPLLKGKDVNKYDIKFNDYYVLYPYKLSDNKVYSEDELSRLFPKSYKYFLERKTLLSGRPYFEKSNKLWFELWNERNYLKFNQIKIVNAEISPENRFQIDYDGYFGNTKIFSTVLKDEYDHLYLNFLGLLNSKLLNYYHKKIASPKAGGFYDYKTQFIQKYPIKVPENITILNLFVGIILFAKSASEIIIDNLENNHIANFFEELIDAVVFETYFPEEMYEKNITVISDIENILAEKNTADYAQLDDDAKIKMVSTLYFTFKENEVQQKMRKFVTASPDVLKIILQA